MLSAPPQYQNIPSTGIIPADRLPADQISFAYSFTYEKDLDPSAGFQTSLNGQIIIELRDAAGDVKATFDFKETYDIVMFPVAPNLVFYIWQWNANKEKFKATDTQDNPIEAQSQASRGAEPASGNGSSDKAAYISSKFYSVSFKVDVEEGDILKIVKHTLSAGSVTAPASLQVALHEGGSTTPALVDGRVGQQLRVVSEKGEARMVRSRRLESPIASSQTEWPEGVEGLVQKEALKGVQLARGEGAAFYVLGTSNGQMRLFFSQNEGKNWQQIMSVSSEIKILASRLARYGRYIIYGVGTDKKPAYVILKHGADGWTTSETGPCTGPDLPVTKVNSLEDGEGSALRLLANDKDGTLRLWLSHDGKAWEQTPITQEPNAQTPDTQITPTGSES